MGGRAGGRTYLEGPEESAHGRILAGVANDVEELCWWGRWVGWERYGWVGGLGGYLLFREEEVAEVLGGLLGVGPGGVLAVVCGREVGGCVSKDRQQGDGTNNLRTEAVFTHHHPTPHSTGILQLLGVVGRRVAELGRLFWGCLYMGEWVSGSIVWVHGRFSLPTVQ